MVAIFSLFMLANGMTNLITGYAAAGGTTALGSFSTGNPGFGAVKGNIVWVIYDSDGETIIGSDAPDEEITVYFVPRGNHLAI